MSAYFVTSTGTDIGKTFVTAGLVRHLRGQGMPAAAIKPVVSGFDRETAAGSDPGVLLAAMGEEVTPATLNRVAPWRFTAPLSPDMAAAREGKEIDVDVLVNFCRDAIEAAPATMFIEGVGGVMVPLDRRRTVLDWMAGLNRQTILVTGSYLGTISHTLTAIDCMKSRKLILSAIVISETGDCAVPLEDTSAAIARFVPKVPIVVFPRTATSTQAAANFAVLWDAIR